MIDFYIIDLSWLATTFLASFSIVLIGIETVIRLGYQPPVESTFFYTRLVACS